MSVDWDDVSGADSYQVRWREGVRGTQLNDGVSVTASQATITVAATGEWIVKVFACQAADCGRGTSTRFEVEAAPPQPPATPTGLTVSTTAGSLNAALDWDDAAGADDYLVRWRLAGPGQDLNDGVRPTSSATSVSVAAVGRYVVRVQACNEAGCSGSVAREFTVEAAQPPTKPT